ncbi:RAB11 interacting protein 2 (class I) [Chamberlinius hualienensis]
MWSPTHVQVIVQKAKNLRIKGKNGANDTYVTIQLGKEKFQTSVQEKTTSPEWHEECELTIPDGNTSSITLTVFHRNFMGMDKFLGRVDVPLQELDIYERPRNKIYPLQGKPNSHDGKVRGELEVRFAFVVKSVTGSLMDLSKKPQKSNSLPLKMVHSVGGSLMNLGGKDKKLSLGNLKSSLGGKLRNRRKKGSSSRSDSVIEEGEINDDVSIGDVDDISEYDAVSIASSSQTSEMPSQLTSSTSELYRDLENTSSRNLDHPPSPSPVYLGSSPKSNTNAHAEMIMETFESPSQHKVSSESIDNNEKLKPVFQDNKGSKPVTNVEKEVAVKNNDNLKSARRQINSLAAKAKPITNLVKSPFHHSSDKSNGTSERSVINYTEVAAKPEKWKTDKSDIAKLSSNEVMSLYDTMTKQELVELLCKQRTLLEHQQKHISSLEDYIDNLLVRVMDASPRILQNPYKGA